MKCPLPWIGQSFKSNGDMRVCCQASQGPARGIPTKNGIPFNARTANLNEFRNSDLMVDIRKTMLDDKWHPECTRCEREHNSNMKSRAAYENTRWIESGDYSWDDLISNTHDGVVDTTAIPVGFYDLRFGNLCNLKCRMCGPTDSSQWYGDSAKMWGPEYYDSGNKISIVKNVKGKYEPRIDIYNWHESKSFWGQLEVEIPNIKKVYVVGGEPLMINEHYTFLQKCVDAGHATHMEIEYNTNLTNIPVRAFDIWKRFKKVIVGVSLDGVGDVNDYIRHPSNFNSIIANIKKLAKSPGNFEMWVAPTISIFNIFHLPDMLKWLINEQLPTSNDAWRSLMTPHPLHSPPYLNVQVLPASVKKIVDEKFTAAKLELATMISDGEFSDNRKKSMLREVPKILDRYSKFMNAFDLSEHQDTFWDATTRLDKIRGQSIYESLPELCNHFIK